MDLFILSLELIGAVAFAVSGAMVAMRKNMDIFGVCVLGLVTAVGGGVLRDILLGTTPPKMFSDPIYVIAATITCLIIFIPHIRKLILKIRHFMNFSDAIGLGIFTMSGALNAFEISGTNMFLAIFVGVMTGVGGGIMRDVLAGEVPLILRKHVYATAAIAGALVFVVLHNLIDIHISILVSTGVTIIIRLISIYFGWNLPKPRIQ